jgi:hypothetical protein
MVSFESARMREQARANLLPLEALQERKGLRLSKP